MVQVAFFGHHCQPGEKLDVVKAVGTKGSLNLTSVCLAEDSGSATLILYTPEGLKFTAGRVSTTKPFHRLDLKCDMSVSPWLIEVSGAKVDIVGFVEDDGDSEPDTRADGTVNGNAEAKAKSKTEGKIDERSAQKPAFAVAASSISEKDARGKSAELAKSKKGEAEIAKKPDTNKTASAVAAVANSQSNQKRKAEEPPKTAPPVKKVATLAGGLKYEVIKSSSHPQTACRGRNVQVKYEGRLASNGKRFDKGTIRFKLGAGEVIKGWDLGVDGMKVGERRKLLIPPQLGYGQSGAPPDIPRNAALVFEVELLKV